MKDGVFRGQRVVQIHINKGLMGRRWRSRWRKSVFLEDYLKWLESALEMVVLFQGFFAKGCTLRSEGGAGL